ncbi:MAG: TetR/AcrR family transcriptional regulator [Spirochaetales bacterium]|nr:TetR/AcrR family transcriptional regulator [Spirochaetales bacterium]
MSQIKRKPRESQIEESRKWIAEAYLQILSESSGDSRITISAIAARAGVSRQTLYRHFSSCEEILDWYLERQFSLFMKQISKEPGDIDFHMANLVSAMEFFRDNETLISTLTEQKKEYLVLNKLEHFTRRFVRNYLDEEVSKELFYREKAFTGSFYMVMRGWLERKQSDPPEQLLSALLPFLQNT